MGDVKTPALWSLIQAHLDEYGVTDAEFARRMGVSPQTLNSWKKRGVRQLPTRDKLESVAELTRNTYTHVLDAALVDAGYKNELRSEVVEVAQRIRNLGAEYWDALDDLIEELRQDHYARLAAQRPKLRDLIDDDPPAAQSRASGSAEEVEKTQRAVGRRRSNVRPQPVTPVGSDWAQRAVRAANAATESAGPSVSDGSTGERLVAAAGRRQAIATFTLLDALDEILSDAESVDDQKLAELPHDALEDLGSKIADIYAAINSGQFHADVRAEIAARADDIDVRRRALKDRLSAAHVSNVQRTGDTTPDPGSGVDANDPQSSVDLAHRRGPGRTKGERIRDEFDQLGEESQVPPDDEGV